MGGAAEGAVDALVREAGRIVGALALMPVIGSYMIVLHNISGSVTRGLICYLDLPSFLIVAGFLMLLLTASGALEDFFKGFARCFSRADKATGEEYLASAHAMGLAVRCLLLTAPFTVLWDFVVIMMTYFDRPEQLGPSLAVAVLTCLYAIFLAMLFTVVKERLLRKSAKLC